MVRPIHRTVPRSLTLLLLAVLLVVGLAPTSVVAHSGKQSYLYVSVYDDGVEGRVEMPVADLGAALDVDIPSSAGAVRADLPGLTDRIRTYVTENFSLGDASGPWQVDLADTLTVLPTENGPYVVLDYVVDEEFDEAPTSFTAEFSVIVENDPEKDSLLIVEDDWASATFDNGSEPLLGFSTGQTEQRVDLGGASTLDSMIAVRGLGTDSVRTGIDVMLIVVAVALPAIMVPSTTRGHVVSATSVARRSVRSLLVLVGGHSAALWLVGLGVITPSPRIVGVLVATGLGAMAVFGLIAWWKPSRWSLAPAVIAVVGVLQGLGLGEFFLADGLDRRRPITSLIAFNIGVEIGLIILATLVIVPLALLRRTRLAPIVTIGLGAALTGYALAWLLERLVNTDWPIEEVANPLRVWPRNLLFVAIAVVFALAVRRLDARSNKLMPVEGAPSSDPSSRARRPDRERTPA